MFTVQPHAERRLVLVKFERAFWDEQVVDRFVSACVSASVGMPWPVGSHRTLVDLRNATIQSQAVIARLQQFMGNPGVGFIALVATTPLERMQSRRLLVREGVKLFDTIDDAVEWLGNADGVSQAA